MPRSSALHLFSQLVLPSAAPVAMAAYYFGLLAWFHVEIGIGVVLILLMLVLSYWAVLRWRSYHVGALLVLLWSVLFVFRPPPAGVDIFRRGVMDRDVHRRLPLHDSWTFGPFRRWLQQPELFERTSQMCFVTSGLVALYEAEIWILSGSTSGDDCPAGSLSYSHFCHRHPLRCRLYAVSAGRYCWVLINYPENNSFFLCEWPWL